MKTENLSRRRFLSRIAALGGGVVVGINLPGCTYSGTWPIDAEDSALTANAFLQIRPDNSVTFYCPSDEMGQGVHTGLATIIGEEFDVHPSAMTVKSAGSHADYNNPEFGIQLTGGSNAVRAFWPHLRQIGADTRALIIAAAAQDLGVLPEQLSTDNGCVIMGARRYPYGQFVKTAALLPMPNDTALKSPADFKFVGTEFTRLDALAKSTGIALYGIDADLPNMVYAVVARPPVAGASVVSFDDSAAKQLRGVVAVFAISSGVAVVADRFWHANRAARALKIIWSDVPLADVDSAQVKRDLATALDNDTIAAGSAGDIEQSNNAVHHQHQAEFFAPFLAHAPLEPVNATLHVRGTEADLYTGVQSPQAAQGIIERLLGLPRGNIRIHNQYLGGGFGRRGTLTHVVEVAEIARKIDRPVQLLWSREDDLRHGLYRPASLMRIHASVDTEGRVSSWRAKRAGGNITGDTLENMLPAMLPGLPTAVLRGATSLARYVFSQWSVDPSSVEGLHETYDFRHWALHHATVDHGLPMTFWRSVGHSYTAFAVESMMDELAEQVGLDPIAFRLLNTSAKPKMHRVLSAAQQIVDQWDLPQGHHLGVACHSSFNTDVAQIAQVSVVDGAIRVHRVSCIADVGTVVNPDIVRAQLEGAVMFALTATLHGQIDLAEGKVVQSNFHDYPLLRMNEAPSVDVTLLDSAEDPTGIGEPGVPPLAPAVANAVYRACGQRLRELPLRLS